MKHELHDSERWFAARAHSEKLHDVVVIETFHHLCLAQKIQLEIYKRNKTKQKNSDAIEIQ